MTAIIARPAVFAPAERIFGHEIVGRHHDPFTVMRQMAGAGPSGPYIQPVTDGLGWLLARFVEPVAAYNILVLSTFPLTAAATYLLARYLRASHVGAIVASLLFTFAPLHLAHAAYHPHIAQTQWLPVYVLALAAAIDRPSLLRLGALIGAAAGLVLSNFYGGLIGAVISPVFLVSYWWTSPHRPPVRHLWITASTLGGLAAAGLAMLAFLYPQLVNSVSTYAVPVSDVARYSARWWAYGLPSVSHVVFGPDAADVLVRNGVTTEMLEQQIFVSYSAVALALGACLIAAFTWNRDRGGRQVMALLITAAVAAVVSIGPGTDGCTAASWTPACGLHAVAPMFRAFARFAFVVHLGVALAAAMAVTWLVRRGRWSKVLATALIVVACFEYWPLPARARDVLPTTAHRWLVRETDAASHTLDCGPFDLADVHLAWLMQRRLSFPGADVTTCRDTHLGEKAAALGYTHVLVRRPDRTGADAALDDSRSGLTRVGAFADAALYAVTTAPPLIAVLSASGFHEYERLGSDVWQWMGAQGQWRVRNTGDRPLNVRLSADLDAAIRPRTLTVSLDGTWGPAIVVAEGRASYTLGRWLLVPGDHVVGFATGEPPFRPSDDGRSVDDRWLTIAFRDVQWIEENEVDARTR
ncbi:hypothetical protein [Mycolicibacterium sp.]|uniref:hypothetical protein n=1 Tax=Mycolicibacterium sp. TaxID=2320850 RepID=UPI0037CAADCC